MNNEGELYVPRNITTRFEIVNGYGISELIVNFLALCAVLPFAFILYYIFNDIFKSMFLIFLTVSAVFFLVRKNEQGISVVDMMKFLAKFQKSQKRYEYKYTSRF